MKNIIYLIPFLFITSISNAGMKIYGSENPIISGSSFSVGGSTLVVSGGKVGIGTTAPTYKLTVSEAQIGANMAHILNTGTNRGVLFSNDTNEAGIVGYGSTYNALEIRATTGRGTGIYFNTAGNVGIGTTAPGAKLHVSSGVFTLDGTNSYFNIAVSSTITTATDPCAIGDLRRDADYFYLCTAANTWKRSAFATWP